MEVAILISDEVYFKDDYYWQGGKCIMIERSIHQKEITILSVNPLQKKSLEIRKSDRAERRNWQIYNHNRGH